MNPSVFCYRKVHEERTIVSDRPIIQIGQLVNRFHFVIFLFVVKPSGSDAHITFCCHPCVAVSMSLLQFRIAVIAGIDFIDSQERPVRCKGISFLIAYPTTAGTSVAEDDSFGLKPFNCAVSTRIIIKSLSVDDAILPCSAIISVTAVSTVEPNFKHFAVLCQQFFQLSMEIFTIERCPVKCLMTVPR